MKLQTTTTLLLGLCCFFAASLAAQAAVPTSAYQTQQQLKLGPNGNETIHYLLTLPKGYAQSKGRWPLMLFLHGAGERGNELRLVAKHGPPRLAAQNRYGYGAFIIVSPQCPKGAHWSDKVQLARLEKLIDHIKAGYRVDSDRIYVTGLSMGGYGTWHLAAAMPGQFAAIAPICGGGNPRDAEKLAGLPIWAFHGAKDRVVPLAQSQQMVDAVKAQRGDVKFTVYPDAGHDSWSTTYANPDLNRWFLGHKRP